MSTCITELIWLFLEFSTKRRYRFDLAVFAVIPAWAQQLQRAEQEFKEFTLKTQWVNGQPGGYKGRGCQKLEPVNLWKSVDPLAPLYVHPSPLISAFLWPCGKGHSGGTQREAWRAQVRLTWELSGDMTGRQWGQAHQVGKAGDSEAAFCVLDEGSRRACPRQQHGWRRKRGSWELDSGQLGCGKCLYPLSHLTGHTIILEVQK